MNTLLLIVIFTAIGGVLSVLAASVFLLLPERARQQVLPHGISFAIGALLTGAFCGLIPHAFEDVARQDIAGLSATILAGILGFFTLEKLLVWRHCHSHACEAHGEDSHDHHEHGHPAGEDHGRRVAGMFIILGDGIHNFVDGVLIGAAFLTDPQLGIVTSLAVAAHEIPQEVGDFAILLHSGYTRRKALFYNMLASLTTVIGGILAYFSLGDLHHILPYFLTLAASSFIYIAVADLIPSLHRKTDSKASLQQIGFILAGVVLILTMQNIAHRYEAKIVAHPLATSSERAD
ncbi:ZIP family metal transporter [Methylomonas sp. MED-D]|uniref:ZIP zinc transporter n=1 Tax=Methylomonas koyamae TaxID=702114 RepID=A0A177N9D6_9GAMM|nr:MULTISPECIES: ZIP family metal transporter [Methylomonas]NJA04419.1 ZIP family metal transporter [Methylococcaceae bacterium WWC4]MDT4332026.1 ZIP family metal transporter [Methylomonas sp. MV1]OAI14557.1 ZIP zinc transporter [Methylomonas koyamae]OHX35626.1 ZIP zinc transporter [Methylomonas sp. LWB]WGS85805.1 ZIP family metal transporter [Methylomonas sp. UP202]